MEKKSIYRFAKLGEYELGGVSMVFKGSMFCAATKLPWAFPLFQLSKSQVCSNPSEVSNCLRSKG